MNRVIDLTGQTFGFWNVLGLDANKDTKRGAFWISKCVCGKEKSLESQSLRKGATKSCGCQRFYNIRNKIKVEIKNDELILNEKITRDLTGKQRGSWFIMGMKEGDERIWLCRCVLCGHETFLKTQQLRKDRGKRYKCKCEKSNHKFIGQKFGSLIVLESPRSIKGKNVTKAKCRCDCGNELDINKQHLIKGYAKSCGCQCWRYDEFGNSEKKQGRIRDKSGYVRIYAPNHPRTDKRGYVFEHIVVMSNFLNRPVTKQETVHHKNGIRDDNRIENLELWNKNHGAGQRAKDIYEFCVEFITKHKEEYESGKLN